MIQKYAMDDKVILSLQGLRSVKKYNYIHYGPDVNNVYKLQWNYKGSDGYVEYKTESERDEIFNEIKKAIKNRKEPHKPD